MSEDDGRRRRRGPRKRGGDTGARPAAPARSNRPTKVDAAPKDETPAAVAPVAGAEKNEPRKPRRAPKAAANKKPEAAKPSTKSLGFGDDTPAFLLRPVKVS